MIIIDYSRVNGPYKGKNWLLLEQKQILLARKIDKWKAVTGPVYESRNGRLYEDGQPVYKWKGWGMGSGSTYYEAGRTKYKRSLGDKKDWYEGYLKKVLKPFVIPDITAQHKRR